MLLTIKLIKKWTAGLTVQYCFLPASWSCESYPSASFLLNCTHRSSSYLALWNRIIKSIKNIRFLSQDLRRKNAALTWIKDLKQIDVSADPDQEKKLWSGYDREFQRILSSKRLENHIPLVQKDLFLVSF